MLKFALPPTRNIKFALPPMQNPNSRPMEYRLYWVPNQTVHVGHVHFMFFCAHQRSPSLQCNMVSVNDIDHKNNYTDMRYGHVLDLTCNRRISNYKLHTPATFTYSQINMQHVGSPHQGPIIMIRKIWPASIDHSVPYDSL